MLSIVRDGIGNALFLGYREYSGVAFLSPWQQSIGQSFAPPLWTLSIEFYGSLAVLLLCSCARQARSVWWAAVVLATIFTIRSAATEGVRSDNPADRVDTSARGAVRTVVAAVGQTIAAVVSNLPGALAHHDWPGSPDFPALERGHRPRTGASLRDCRGDQHCL